MALKLRPTGLGSGVNKDALSPKSIVLRCRVTVFAELRQMLLVDAINLGLHLGMPALDQDRELTDQPSRAKPVEKDFLCWALGQGVG